jgi:hypothetical protein
VSRTFFRPRWPEAEVAGTPIEPWHVWRPSLGPTNDARCGASWPKALTHGYYETRSVILAASAICSLCSATVAREAAA